MTAVSDWCTRAHVESVAAPGVIGHRSRGRIFCGKESEIWDRLDVRSGRLDMATERAIGKTQNLFERGRELGEIDAHLPAAAVEQGSVFALEGRSGMGKSALLAKSGSEPQGSINGTPVICVGHADRPGSAGRCAPKERVASASRVLPSETRRHAG